MNIARLLAMSTTVFGDRPAAAVGRTTLRTYAQLEDRVSRFAGTLRTRFALEPGDRRDPTLRSPPNCPTIGVHLYMPLRQS